ncbi:MAG: alpha/beta fold hydrolase [Flavitalea sp.]
MQLFKKLFFFLPLLAFFYGSAQQFERRPFLGAALSGLTADLKKQFNYSGTQGVLIQSVLKNSMAEKAELKPGDIILSVNGNNVSSTVELIAALKKVSGNNLRLSFWRAGKIQETESIVIRYPNEQIQGAKLEYGSVQVNDSYLRTIITRPANSSGKLPAIFYIQGVSCGSVDFGMDSSSSQFKLIKKFAEAGFITYRVEKSQVGDSRGGPACAELDFATELEGYKQGLKELKHLSGVDSNNIYLFGHSMGGVMAPLVARHQPVKGIIVYGSIVKPLAEYLIESRRIQTLAMELSPAQSEQYMQVWSKCAPLFLYSKDSSGFIESYPDCAPILEQLNFRSARFWRQLARTDLVEAWQNYPGKVLALWGDKDLIADRSDHALLASIVNQAHKGNGLFMEVPNSTHELYIATSTQTAGYNNRQFNPETASMTLHWISNIEKPGKKTFKNFSDKDAKLLFQEDGIESAYPRWVGGTNRIIFQSNRSGKWQLYQMNRDGTGLKRLTNDHFNNNFVDVSADGKKIAFVSDRDGNEEIYIMDIDGTNIGRLTNDPARDIHPYFSPDSKKLLFNSTRNNAGQNFDIFEMNTDGSGLRLVYGNQNEKTCARYSPDMKSIIFLSGIVSERNDEVTLLDLASGNVRNITKSIAAEGWPVWSGKGDAIIYSSDATGVFRLYSTDTKGTVRKQLSFSKMPYRDARASVHPVTGEIIFNRQEGDTIGIYLLNQ